ncbi:MAG: hypothetical protein MI919_41485, partial [Holophagales bacterium]|nr:hypothetical protein [Holophagales bacterium]
ASDLEPMLDSRKRRESEKGEKGAPFSRIPGISSVLRPQQLQEVAIPASLLAGRTALLAGSSREGIGLPEPPTSRLSMPPDKKPRKP